MCEVDHYIGAATVAPCVGFLPSSTISTHVIHSIHLSLRRKNHQGKKITFLCRVCVCVCTKFVRQRQSNRPLITGPSGAHKLSPTSYRAWLPPPVRRVGTRVSHMCVHTPQHRIPDIRLYRCRGTGDCLLVDVFFPNIISCMCIYVHSHGR